MKREILFRGKSTRFNSWQYGLPYSSGHDDIIDQIVIGEYHEDVYPETVSQFTGLTDKNGVKIFEGDIVKFSTRRYHLGIDKGLQTITFKSDVIFQDGCFIISETQKYDTYLYAFNNESEIIGNIHE